MSLRSLWWYQTRGTFKHLLAPKHTSQYFLLIPLLVPRTSTMQASERHLLIHSFSQHYPFGPGAGHLQFSRPFM